MFFSGASQVAKNPSANAGDMRRGFNRWVGKIPWRRAWQPTPVFLPGESHDRGAWWAIVHWAADRHDSMFNKYTEGHFTGMFSVELEIRFFIPFSKWLNITYNELVMSKSCIFS